MYSFFSKTDTQHLYNNQLYVNKYTVTKGYNLKMLHDRYMTQLS